MLPCTSRGLIRNVKIGNGAVIIGSRGWEEKDENGPDRKGSSGEVLTGQKGRNGSRGWD